MPKIPILLCLSLLMGFNPLTGQESVWLENEISEKTELYYHKNEERRFHASVKAYVIPDSVKKVVYGPEKWNVYLQKKGEKAGIRIMPLLQTTAGASFNNASSDIFSQLGIGLVLQSWIGKQLSFSMSAYFEELINPPYYIGEAIVQTHVIPGMGTAYPGELGYNTTRIDARLAYQPYDFLRLEIGNGKQFIGDGYRSFFVSDIASNNPYGRLNVTIWHLNFSATYSSLTSSSPYSIHSYQKFGKYTARHYLSWNATKTLRFGFFESVVWQASDGDNYRGFDVHYANPIQFYRPVEYSIGSADNSLLGFDISWNIKRKWNLYTQIMLDEFLLREVTAGDGWWANKYAFQLGLKVFEPFSAEGLFVRLEFNMSRPFTFAHGSQKQNYAHLGEAIAHPLGSNFYEGIIEANFPLGKRGRLENFLLVYLKGEDPVDQNLGGDIFKPYTNPTNQYGNYIGQGDQRSVFLYRIQYSYLLSSENRLKLIASMQIRAEEFLYTRFQSSQYLIGISTTIWNRNSAF